MAKINTPVDHMFRAGQISSKEWRRLSMKQPGKGRKTKGRMANFDAKKKDEAGAREIKSVSSTKKGHIDGPDQGMSGRGAVRPPTKGGGVQGSNAKPSAGDQPQKFPAQGSGRKPQQAYGRQQPSSTNEKGGQYGGPSSRQNAPSRLGRAETRGGSW